MPCRSDYMEPTDYEKRIYETIKNLLWLHTEMNWPQPEELTHAYTQSYFTRDEGDVWVAMLCSKLTNMSEEEMERVVFNAHSKKSRRLADWWEEHQKADAEREAVEREEKRLAKEKIDSMTPNQIKDFLDND